MAVAPLELARKELEPDPLIVGKHSDEALTKDLLRTVWTPPGREWWLLFTIAASGVGLLVLCLTIVFLRGIGVWGTRIPAAWAFPIVNFVWWIGIGHAGTLISAILLLFQQKWRTSINRFSETMTLFAVMCAGLFPLVHMGRPWFFYWMLPYPSTLRLWPQFRSALVWDVFAVSTYLTVSILFWYQGLVPDFAALRDASKRRWQQMAYGILALGWRGTARHWKHYQSVYLILAGLATPLVLSVHSVVSFDFAIALVPGWHSTIFPPYFVAGAIFSGFAMVLTLMLPARKYLKLENVITLRHIHAMGKIILVTSWIVIYGYSMEHFMAMFSANKADVSLTLWRPGSYYAGAYWGMLLCNCVVPQLLWWKGIRENILVLWVISVLINVGMWLERFVIIVVSLSHEFMPSIWRNYSPTWLDYGTFIGTLSLFSMLFLLALRLIPIVPVSEVKELSLEMKEEAHQVEEHAA
jgi:molybdopterin-containing oxidoreductase family membrane subunit